jgi:hypothetical protein
MKSLKAQQTLQMLQDLPLSSLVESRQRNNQQRMQSLSLTKCSSRMLCSVGMTYIQSVGAHPKLQGITSGPRPVWTPHPTKTHFAPLNLGEFKKSWVQYPCVITVPTILHLCSLSQYWLAIGPSKFHVVCPQLATKGLQDSKKSWKT